MEHDLVRFSHWTVYCKRCDTEFQDPNGKRKLPFASEVKLPKLKDNPQCVHSNNIMEEKK